MFFIDTRKSTHSRKVYNGLVVVSGNEDINITDHRPLQLLIFICSADQLKRSLRKLKGIFGLRKKLLEKELDYEEIYENIFGVLN